MWGREGTQVLLQGHVWRIQSDLIPQLLWLQVTLCHNWLHTQSFKFGAFKSEGYRSTNDYYDIFDAFLFYWKDNETFEPIVLPKVGGSPFRLCLGRPAVWGWRAAHWTPAGPRSWVGLLGPMRIRASVIWGRSSPDWDCFMLRGLMGRSHCLGMSLRLLLKKRKSFAAPKLPAYNRLKSTCSCVIIMKIMFN